MVVSLNPDQTSLSILPCNGRLKRWPNKLFSELFNERFKYWTNKRTWFCIGGTQVWTRDPSICSRMLYHWAIPPHLMKYSWVNSNIIDSDRSDVTPGTWHWYWTQQSTCQVLKNCCCKCEHWKVGAGIASLTFRIEEIPLTGEFEFENAATLLRMLNQERKQCPMRISCWSSR